jgi:hypothetical protein
MAVTRIGITAGASALTGAVLVGIAIVVAAWAALATYDIVAARFWADQIVAELRIAPGYAGQAAGEAQAIAMVAAALALIGAVCLYEGWRATRSAPEPVTSPSAELPPASRPAANDGFARGMIDNPRAAGLAGDLLDTPDVGFAAPADNASNASNAIEELSGIKLSERQREALAKLSPEQRERVAKIAGVLGKITHE